MKHLLLALIALQVAACSKGKTGGPSHKALSGVDGLQATTEETMTYMASFNSLNEKYAGKVSGSMTIHKEGDFLVAHVRVTGAAPDTIHAQNVHIGELCPTEGADRNLDGVIDYAEAKLFTDNVIIPLDGDLNSQYSLSGMYPTSDTWGAYVYSQTASFARFIADLTSDDEDPSDEIIKLGSVPFNLEGKVVLIQGIKDDAQLPESAEGVEGLTATQTLPVACGVLHRVWEVPGEIEEDDVAVGSTRSTPRIPGDNTVGGGGTESRNGGGSPLGRRKPCVRGPDGKTCVMSY